MSADPSISTANAASFGVKWMTYTGKEILDSPVAAWNATLQKTLVYVGNEAGYFTAYDQATGAPVWSVDLGGEIRSTALVSGSDVWVAPSTGGRAYKLNAATGATECSANIANNIAEGTNASPVIATPPGGKQTVYFGENDIGTDNGPITAVTASDCTVLFSVTPEPKAGSGGTWDFLSYGVNASGTGLLFFGTADPDSAVYAVNAITGATVWRFAVANPLRSDDVGAGLTVSPPGNNGFADGVVYVASKHGIMYALNLATGVLIWQYDFGAQTGLNPTGSLDTAALTGNTLVFGDNGGVWSLNAVTGAKNWYRSFGAGGVVDGAPAIIGPTGSQVVAATNELGQFTLLNLATGTQMYTYQTGAFSASSPAEVSGNVLDISGSGFLYDFAPGASAVTAPRTAITSPASGSSTGNPNGSLKVSGTATGSAAITGVDLYIQRDGSAGEWWDGVSKSWTVAPYPNPATLADPGKTSTTWSALFPVPGSGGSFEAFASASSGGTADQSIGLSATTKAISSFTVKASSTATMLTASAGFVVPGTPVTVSGSGFKASEPVTITLDAKTLATVTATSTGALPSTSVTVPTPDAFGPATILATGATSGDVGAAPVYVANGWSQYGGNASHQGTDPNDKVFLRHLSVSPGTYLATAWSFNAGAPITSSVIVHDGEGYFVDQTGEVFDVDIRTGMLIWSYQIADKALVDTTPALVLPDDLVLVASTDGTVTALNKDTGAVTWTKTIGGELEGSPTVSGNNAYVVSDSGVVAALDATTGNTIWQTKMAAPIKTSPAVDSVSGRVFVADTAGTVEAFRGVSGATVWAVKSLGAFIASLVVGQGNVYAASQNGTLYALAETTGAQAWTFADGSPITATPVDDEGQLTIGDAAGHVHVLDAATGTTEFNVTAGAPVVGLAAAQGFVTTVMANGSILGSKPADTDPHAWETTDGTSLDSQPTIVNGEVIVASQSGTVTVYTTPGSQPS
ncbi:MAG TPA: PQQ-binding-like beta-propeller repeat protein [Streptosporangiaceae bacterium]|nr:PQQ-binding-like beta-propeller repeat protein [Streptosporangiaceae bacterium]